MSRKSRGNPVPGELAIFARLLESTRGKLTASLARYLLTLGFDEADQARMRELAARNQEGSLSEDERAALNNYVRAGHMLAVLQSKARVALREKRASRGTP